MAKLVNKKLPSHCWTVQHLSEDVMIVTINGEGTSMRVVNSYVPAEGSPHGEAPKSTLEQARAALIGANEAMLVGDFNLHHPW